MVVGPILAAGKVFGHLADLAVAESDAKCCLDSWHPLRQPDVLVPRGLERAMKDREPVLGRCRPPGSAVLGSAPA